MSEPIENSHISFRSLPFPIILNFPTCSDSEKNLGGARNLAPDPGARNFRIFKTPKKITSFYSKDFLPKLIFLRKGVHHPKFRIFGGPRKKSGFPEIPEISKSVFSTFWSKFRYFLSNLILLDLRSHFWQY